MDSIGLPNAKLIWDHYHLIHHVWKNAFRRCHGKVHAFLRTMIDTFQEVDYNVAYHNLLKHTEEVPAEHKYAQEQVHGNRKFFA